MHIIRKFAPRVLLLVVLADGAALGFEFTPIQPAPCPLLTEVDFSYNVGGGTNTWEQPRDWNDTSVYIDNINHTRTIIGNTYTSKFGLRFDAFETEACCDSFWITNRRDNTSTILSGTPALGWRDVDFYPDEMDQYSIRTQFFTDHSIGKPGFSIGKAHLCYDGDQGWIGVPNLIPGERHMGVLLGTGDAIWVYTDLSPSSDVHTTFALWGGAGSAASDFDLFARCDAAPTPTAWDVAARSGDTQEFIHVDSTICPPNHALYLVVHAYRGSGSFNLVQHRHKSSEHYPVGTADTRGYCSVTGTTNCPADSAKVATWQSVMSKGFKRYFGATEGSQFWGALELYNTGRATRPITFSIGSDRAHSDVCGGGLYMYWSDYALGGATDNDQTLAHELGHLRGCVYDEYNSDNSALACGHSIMASPYGSVNNFCYCSDWSQGQSYGQLPCHLGAGDHNLDPTTGQSPDNDGPVWTNLQGRTPVLPMTTPDSYDYADFDFNGLYDVSLH